jgi:hypothetical protein
MATATRTLQEKIEERQRTEATAKQEILRAETIAKEEVQRATTKRDNLVSWMTQEIANAKIVHGGEIHTVIPYPLDYLFPFEGAMGRGIIIAILGVIPYIYLVKDYTIGSLILIGFLAFLATIVLSAIRWLKARASYKAKERSKVRTASAAFQERVEAAQQKAKAAEEDLRKVTEASNKQLREVKSVCENNMKRAEVHRKKAEDALQWFKAQPSNQ